MSKRVEEPRRNGWRGAVAAALLLAAWHGAKALLEPELHMRMEVAVLVGGTGFAVALIR
ncbi:MAG TPA: hypothetical protein VEZ48_03640 [Sphingomonadaceae bacterium]|nr:hypothetical protein [Sphingomonadaceae bacterium]